MLEKKVIINEISADELADMVAEKLMVKMEKYIQDYVDFKQDYLMTREEAASFLSIDSSTLYHWVNKDKVKCYGIGGRRYFIKQELIEVIKRNKLSGK